MIFCRGSKYARSRHDGTHAAPRGTQRYRKAGTGAMADSASYAYGAQRAVAQRKRWAQADEDVAATKPRGGGETGPGISENIMRISRARPGRRPVRLETRWRGRADVAWDCNLAGLVGLGPVILKISPTGPGAGCQAPSARPSSTPPPRVGPARKNRWISSIGFFRT